MDLSKIEKEDLEDIVCEMLEDIKEHNLSIYDKYTDILDDILYGIDEKEAVDIVHSFKPNGEAFSKERVKEILHRLGKSEDCYLDYYMTMNMIYNDFKPYAESKRLDIQDFCIEMSKLFINDIDAPKHKVSKYFSMFLDEEEFENE